MTKYRAISDTGKRSPMTDSREELDRWSSLQVTTGDADVVWQYAVRPQKPNPLPRGDRQELVGRYERPEYRVNPPTPLESADPSPLRASGDANHAGSVARGS